MDFKNVKQIIIGNKVVSSIKHNGQVLWQAFKGVLSTVSGIPPLTLVNSIRQKLDNYKIYGDSVQNGTPTIDTPVEIESVGELITDSADEHYGKYKISIITKGINVFDESKMEYTAGAIVNNHTISYAGTLNVDIKLPAGRYTLICDHNNNMFVRNGKVGSGYVVIKSKTTPYVTFNFTGTYDGYLRLSMFKPANENAMMSNIMIIEGSISAVPQYEPYINPKTTNIYLDEPLRKIGDYADYVDFKDKKEVHYNGSTPIERTIDLPSVPTYEGTTIIDVDTIIKPSNMVINYYATQ